MNPPNKKQFTQTFDDLTKVIDIDDSMGRSVPINMNFTETSYLTKDTGSVMFGATESTLCHSEFNFKKKSGTEYRIRANGTYLQKYNTTTGLYENLTSGAVTMTIATPAVVSQTAHGLKSGSKISFTTTGALPTGVTAGTTYYVIAAGLTTDAFQFSATLAGAAVNTSGSQSGVHTVTRRYTSGAEFGFYVYDDVLYGGNAYENYFSWAGTVFAEFDTAPKGNILEVFEDRMFVSGVRAEPLTMYYSGVGTPTTFGGTDLVKPLGTDSITGLRNYYGVLMIFKSQSIFKLTFQYDQVATAFLPKLELQSGNYGACSRKAVSWVENDLWFFTGTEVRSIGFKDQQIGVLGVNKSVISEQIKETLKLIAISNYNLITTFYFNRKFYLSVPITSQTANDTVFVCHLLYANNWTKYTNRVKATANHFIEVDGIVYSNISSGSYGTLKWDSTLYADIGVAISSEVFFKKIENKEFNVSNLYRYIDLIFKDLQGTVTVTLRQDIHNNRTLKDAIFYVGSQTEGEENALGEVLVGQHLTADAFGESVASTPFLRNKLSCLSKAQSITLGFSNSGLNDRFTLAEYGVTGFTESKNYFNKSQITNLK
jgi:hypothetical protein